MAVEIGGDVGMRDVHGGQFGVQVIVGDRDNGIRFDAGDGQHFLAVCMERQPVWPPLLFSTKRGST